MPVKLFGNFWFFWGTVIRDSQLTGDAYELLWYGFAYRDVSVGIMIRQVKRPAW